MDNLCSNIYLLSLNVNVRKCHVNFRKYKVFE